MDKESYRFKTRDGAVLHGDRGGLRMYGTTGIHLQSGGSQITILPDRIQLIAPKIVIIGGETEVKGQPIKLNCD